MNLRYFLILLVICICSCSPKVAKELNKGNFRNAMFSLSHQPSIALKENINDVVQLLNSANQDLTSFPKFRLTKDIDPTINLTPFQNEESHAFHLTTTEDTIFIYGKNDFALSHGMYYYLESLGYRFYMPGENWTIVPNTFEYQEINKTVSPDFETRRLFAQGGFPNLLNDPNHYVKKEWEKWLIRNRFGETHRSWGHSWQDFNKAYKNILLKHPEYLAEINGKRVKYSPNAKFCISNKSLVKLFIQDRIQAFEKNIQKYGANDFRSKSISVEPSDGLSHCTSRECLAMGSVSDRVYYLANEVAKALRIKHPKALVSLYAYNEHAGVPNKRLEPNVDVFVIPYAFQREATADVLINQWTSSASNLGIYDYFSMPSGAKELPGFNFLNEPEQKLNYWKKKGFKQYIIESSFAKGPLGISNYLLSKLSWNTSLSSKDVFNDLIEQCFPSSSEPMRALFTNWSENYLGEYSLKQSFEYLDQAGKQSNSQKETMRINEIKAYAVFLYYYYNYENAFKNKKPSSKASDLLLDHTWKNYKSMLIHTSWYTDRMVNVWDKSTSVKNKYNFRGANKSYWSTLRSSTEKEIEQNFQRINKDLSSALTIQKNTYPIEKKNLKTYARSKSKKIKYTMHLPNKMHYQADQSETIQIQFKNTPMKGRKDKPVAYLSVTDENGNIVFQKDLQRAQSAQMVNINLPTEGLYTFNFRVLANFLDFEYDARIDLFFDEQPKLAKWPERFNLYISNSIDQFIFDSGTARFKLFDPNGKAFTNIKEGALNSIDISSKMKEQYWSFNVYSANFKIISPSNYKLTPSIK